MHFPYIKRLDSMDGRFLLVITSPGNLICHLRCYHTKSTFNPTVASFSIARISCPAGADVRSTSIGAVGIDVTYRKRSTTFVNV